MDKYYWMEFNMVAGTRYLPSGHVKFVSIMFVSLPNGSVKDQTSASVL